MTPERFKSSSERRAPHEKLPAVYSIYTEAPKMEVEHRADHLPLKNTIKLLTLYKLSSINLIMEEAVAAWHSKANSDLEFFSQVPGLEGIFPELRTSLTRLLDEIENALPGNPVDMAVLCIKTDEVLAPLAARLEELKLDPTSDATQNRILLKDVENLERNLCKVRGEIKLMLIEQQRKEKKWKRLDWSNDDSSRANIRAIVGIHLGLPKTVPELRSKEWQEIREKLSHIRQRDVFEWGLARALGNFAKSHSEAIILAFPEYELTPEVFSRHEYDWGTRETCVANIRRKVSEELRIPAEAPDLQKQRSKWQEIRQKLTAIALREIRAWGLSSVDRSKFFSSYIDALIAAFLEYKLTRKDFQRHEYFWRSEDEAVANVRGKVSEELSIPAVPPDPETEREKWEEIRARITATTAREIYAWGLRRYYEFFRAHGAVLIRAFPEYQLTMGMFQRYEYSWKNEAEAISNVRGRVMAELGLPQIAPSQESPEWSECRAKLLALTSRQLEDEWGMGRFYDFFTYTEVLIASFPEYKLTEEELRKYEFHWRSREEAIANVRGKVSAELGIPHTPPSLEEQPEEWEEIQQDLIATTSTQMSSWGLGGHRRYIGSHIDLLIVAFPEYMLTSEMFQRYEFEWATREQTLANVRGRVSSELNIPDPAPDAKQQTQKWEEIRTKLSNINRKQMIKWRLIHAFWPHKFFNSHVDALIAAFPEYRLTRDILTTQEYSWNSREQTLENVRSKVCEELDIPVRVSPESSNFVACRTKLIALKRNDLRKWGLGRCSTKNLFFNSYADVLIEAFPAYRLERYMFTYAGRTIFLTPSPTPPEEGNGNCSAETNSRKLLIDYLQSLSVDDEGEAEEMAETALWEHVRAFPVEVNGSRRTEEEYRAATFAKMTFMLEELGEAGVNLDLQTLWRNANKAILIHAA